MKYLKSFLDFWNKDIINKLIVLVLILLLGSGLFVIGLIFNMPQGKSLSKAFSNLLPAQVSPTFDINAYLTSGANVPTVVMATTQPATEAPFLLPTFTPYVPAPTLNPATISPEVSPTVAMLPTAELQTATQLAAQVTSAAGNNTTTSCIPNHPPKTGKVVDVLDGNTIKVQIDKLWYVVRYAGIAAPTDKKFADLAKAENKTMVYGKEVTLITDVSDKDSRGRLLRYVILGDTFLNLKMIELGYAAAEDTPPDSACVAAFKQAQQSAQTGLVGMWSAVGTPKP